MCRTWCYEEYNTEILFFICFNWEIASVYSFYRLLTELNYWSTSNWNHNPVVVDSGIFQCLSSKRSAQNYLDMGCEDGLHDCITTVYNKSFHIAFRALANGGPFSSLSSCISLLKHFFYEWAIQTIKNCIPMFRFPLITDFFRRKRYRQYCCYDWRKMIQISTSFTFLVVEEVSPDSKLAVDISIEA